MNVLQLIAEIQRLIDTKEITPDYRVEYLNKGFLGRSTVDYIRIEEEKKLIVLCEEWY